MNMKRTSLQATPTVDEQKLLLQNAQLASEELLSIFYGSNQQNHTLFIKQLQHETAQLHICLQQFK